jgi:hypothetical protein
MNSTTSSWDEAIMLLSADWSHKYLPYIGVEIQANYESGVQHAARNATRAIIGSETSYYNIDFSETRIRKTNQLFLNEVRQKADLITTTHVTRMLELITAASDDEEVTASLVQGAAATLNSDEGSEFPFNPAITVNTTLASRAAWQQAQDWYANLLEESDLACWNSTTEWDEYLRSLTDLPAALASYLSGVADRLGLMPLYWGLLKRRADASELEKLKVWLREVAVYRAHPDRRLVFPAYLEMPQP